MKKVSLLLLSLILLINCKSSKNLVASHIKTGKISYTKYDIITQEAAERMNSGFKKGLRTLYKDVKDSLELETFVNSPSHNVMLTKTKSDSFKFYLEIKKDFYVQPRVRFDNVMYTDRDSLYQCIKKANELSDKCKRKTPIRYFDESQYVIEEFPMETKDILGYECFKVVATKNDKFSKHTYEMYVTNKIKLGYNYTINFKSLNSKYLILELKRTNPVEGVYYGYITNSIEFD